MDFDPLSGGLVLFGGELTGDIVTNNTWLFVPVAFPERELVREQLSAAADSRRALWGGPRESRRARQICSAPRVGRWPQ
jgi:hypothetical protein